MIQTPLASPDLKIVGARATALLCWVDPVEAATRDRDSLTKIAKLAGVTKAAASRWLVHLHDDLGIEIGIWKSQLARRKYREAQIKAFAAGNHARFSARI